MKKGYKICPFCWNEIKEWAIKCQYCKEFFKEELKQKKEFEGVIRMNKSIKNLEDDKKNVDSIKNLSNTNIQNWNIFTLKASILPTILTIWLLLIIFLPSRSVRSYVIWGILILLFVIRLLTLKKCNIQFNKENLHIYKQKDWAYFMPSFSNIDIEFSDIKRIDIKKWNIWIIALLIFWVIYWYAQYNNSIRYSIWYDSDSTMIRLIMILIVLVIIFCLKNRENKFWTFIIAHENWNVIRIKPFFRPTQSLRSLPDKWKKKIFLTPKNWFSNWWNHGESDYKISLYDYEH